jgi:hypothetical protein
LALAGIRDWLNEAEYPISTSRTARGSSNFGFPA